MRYTERNIRAAMGKLYKARTGAVDLAETLQAKSEAPSYTCPRCHRGCMKSTGSDGDWHHMKCPDCGHEEEGEAS
tara:strand:- start:1655 stop:1879 length:225 start_codon:yes stop_codon:yes gene_type:complete